MLDELKLSIEDREALPLSAFCGPCRTFPVTDIAHYNASKKLLDMYDGEEDVSQVCQAIERKGRILGIESRSDDSSQEGEVQPCVAVLEKEIEGLLGEVARLEDVVGDLHDQVKNIEAKYEISLRDVNVVQDRVYQEQLEARELKERYLSLLRALRDGKSVDSEGFKDVSTEVLDGEIKKINEAIDIQKVCDKLNNGMTRTPSGEEVDNPAETILEDEKNQGGKIVPTKEILADIEAKAFEIRMKYGEQSWRDYLEYISAKYKLPESK